MSKRNRKLADCLFPVVLAVYSLLLVNQGITVTDTGYNYGNFIHFESMDVMWKFSTYLATAIGSFFTRLPLGSTMLGLNIYTGLVKASIAILAYFFCIRIFEMPRGVVFLAELVALGFCWCPTALLYNYVTYFLFTLGVFLLCLAVKTEKTRWYVLAGVCLGCNVMVRLPNLAQTALILALWFLCFIQKQGIGELLRKTGYCVLGYLAGFGAIFLYICCRYGLSAYVEGIRAILSMPGEASDYSLKAMIVGQLTEYRYNLKWILELAVVIGIGCVLFAFLRDRFVVWKRIAYVAMNLALFFVFYRNKVISFEYYDYIAIINIGVVFLMVAILVGIYVVLFGKEKYELRFLAACSVLIIGITPLGSNNRLFSAQNNLFVVAPFVFYCIYLLFAKAQKQLQGKLRFCLEPLRISLVLFAALVGLQGVLFGATFVFRDGIHGEKRTEKVTEIPVLKGIYTQKSVADQLCALNDYLEEQHLKEQKAILYHNVPGLCFFLELSPAMSSTWPDLRSFATEKFRGELAEIASGCEAGDRPIVIIGAGAVEDQPKLQMLRTFLEEWDYTEGFSNEMCTVYR